MFQLLFPLTVFAEPAADAATQTPGGLEALSSLALPVLLIVVFYFILIRPQRKKDKAAKNMLANLKVGDKITTIGGVVGSVKKIKDEKIVVETGFGDEKTVLLMDRWAVRDLNNPVSDEK
jgi:preprotein translocase subunit YajC